MIAPGGNPVDTTRFGRRFAVLVVSASSALLIMGSISQDRNSEPGAPVTHHAAPADEATESPATINICGEWPF